MTSVTWFNENNEPVHTKVISKRDLSLTGQTFRSAMASTPNPKGAKHWCATNHNNDVVHSKCELTIRRLSADARKMLEGLVSEGITELDEDHPMYDNDLVHECLRKNWMARGHDAHGPLVSVRPLAQVRGRLRPNTRHHFVLTPGSGWRIM